MRRLLILLATLLIPATVHAQTVGQGAGGTSPWRVDFGGSAQPVSQSGSWTFTFSSPQAVTQSGTWSQRILDGVGNALASSTSAPAGTEQALIVRNIPSGTQTVSGTVTANAGSGTFTNQQSNNTVDTDSGAGTQNTTAFAFALPASGGLVAGGTSSNPLRIDPTGTTTQPVSGTVTANAGSGTFTVSGTVTANAGTNLNTSALALDATLTGGTQRTKVTDGTNNAAVKAASTAAAAADPALVVALSPNSSIPAGSSTIGAVTQASGPWTNNVTQFGSSNVVTGTGAGGSGIPRVTVSNDSAVVQGTAASDTAPWPVKHGVVTATTAAWTSSTTVDTALSLTVTGYSTVALSVRNTSTITAGALVFEASDDGGTNWYGIGGVQIDSNNAVTSHTLVASTSRIFQFGVGGLTTFRARLNPAVTGTGTVNLRLQASNASPETVVVAHNGTASDLQMTATQSGTWAQNVTQFGGTNVSTGTGASGAGIPRVTVANDSNVLVTPPTLTKSTQGSTGFSTQDLKDAGRTAISFYANAVASGTTGTETLITLTQSKGTSATSSASTYTVTSGKKLRITAIIVGSRGNATATAQITTFTLRLNTAGACIVSSTPALVGIATATAAVASDWDRATLEIPEGYEIAGDGTAAICISANAVFTTNAPTWFVNIVGYEY